MAADPSTPQNPARLTEGRTIKNPVYERVGGNMEVFTGWRSAADTKELDQETIKPYDAKMPKKHPCYDLNKILGQCADSCPVENLLAARIARCSEERSKLMVCMNKPANKQWTKQWKAEQAREAAKPKPWWKFW